MANSFNIVFILLSTLKAKNIVKFFHNNIYLKHSKCQLQIEFTLET